MATKPFTVDGNIVVDEATLSNSTSSLVLPAGSIITGGGTVLDATNSDTDDLSEGTANLYFTDARVRSAISATGDISYDSATGVISFTATSAPVTSVNTQTGAVVLDTDNIAEGTNLYYTDARADARITLQAGANLDLSSKTTTDLAEGTNLYYTDARADARIAAASITDLSDADQSVQTTDNVTFANITATGYIAGPATFTIDPAAVGDDTGTLVIAGNLQVDGTTTTINSTTVEVDDLNLTLASGAINAAAANGAGITVDGASATITYDGVNDEWDFNKDINVTGTMFADDGKIISLSPDFTLDGDGDGFPTFRIRRINGSTKTNRSYYFRIFSTGQLALVDETDDNSTRLQFDTNGNIRFFNDSGNTAMTYIPADPKLNLADNTKITLGSGNDLQLYHDGLNSYIHETGTGGLKQLSSYLAIKSQDDSTLGAEFFAGGKVGLRYNNSEKLETTSIGINVTGATITDSLVVGGTTRIGSGSSTGDFKILGNTSTAIDVGGSTVAGVISTYGTSGSAFHVGIEIPSNDTNDGFYIATDADQDGVVDTIAMKINALGHVGIGTNNPLEPFHVYHSGTDTYGGAIAKFQYYDTDDAVLRYDANIGPGGNTYFKTLVTAGSTDFLIVDQDNANDRLSFQVQGDAGAIEGLAVTSTGRVGIGTTSPSELLHANGSIRLTTDVSTTRRLYALSGTGAYSLNSSGGAAIAFHRDASNNDEIAFETHWQGNQHAERMRIDNQGNVGIGETTPAGKLEVQNTSVNYAILGTSNKGHYFESQSDDNTDGFEIYQQHGSTATRNSFIVNDNRTGSKSAALVVRGDGNVGIGTSSPVYPLVVKAANPRLQLLGTGTNTGISGLLFGDADTATRGQINYNHSDDSLDVVVNAAERMRIDSSGRVGIGTSTPDTILEIVSSNPILTLRDTGTGFNNGDATLRLAESGVGDTLGGYFDVRLDASMLKFDFTPEGGSSSTYMAINSSDGRVQIGTQIFGAGQIVSRGEFINFNTGIQTVSSGGSKTLNMFTRSPDAEVSATGTVYIAAENSGGSVQIGCIIDFFFSNGTLNTTARETGSSQGTMTFSVQENGAGMSVTVAYSGGLGGAIRFNAGGHASIASYS